MAQASEDTFDVSSEFIESGISSKPKQKKRGGRYSKEEKTKRQAEVNRLYFEYGYSARKISELMNINRNTINSDINYLYEKTINDSKYINPHPSVIITIQRFDNQRTRLRENLDKAKTFQEIMAVEKMIFNIDCKIIHTQMKLADAMMQIRDNQVVYLNNWLKENNDKKRYMNNFDKFAVSEEAHKKINEIIQRDLRKTRLGV